MDVTTSKILQIDTIYMQSRRWQPPWPVQIVTRHWPPTDAPAKPGKIWTKSARGILPDPVALNKKRHRRIVQLQLLCL